MRRVAAISYSFYADVLFNFNEHTSNWDVQQAILSANLTGGSAFASSAFSSAAALLADPSSGYRGGKVVVYFLTNDVSQDPAEVLEASVDAVRNFPVEIYALGVADQVSPPELRSIVSLPIETHFVPIPTFSRLVTPLFVDDLLDSTCASPIRPLTTSTTTTASTPVLTTTTTNPPLLDCQDFSYIFLLDSSSTFTRADWIKARDYFAQLIDYIPESSLFVLYHLYSCAHLV